MRPRDVSRALVTDHAYGRLPARGEPVPVAAAMLHAPKTCGPATTVGQARAAFADDHVHALLVVEDGTLLAVVERADLPGRPAGAPVRHIGGLAGRTVRPDADLFAVRDALRAAGRRRLAVVDGCGRLLGLLCLKRSGAGFCSDAGVRARQVRTGETHLEATRR
ncbi:CBS domain-containing protein [Pseudonocardia sp. WMMC193]|uniref:CBS domain-containing protein n=1 Tax=Pseudonocardia sp. WMMC193 TaxID=2911965 RepID=UPI001F4827B1|nr:CBS domain-containing protein [Pseudonocardia sp. WMMC193]MCF7551033.1 CBS domain-containing protein [Pseudonocardia sp. WMMC193]